MANVSIGTQTGAVPRRRTGRPGSTLWTHVVLLASGVLFTLPVIYLIALSLSRTHARSVGLGALAHPSFVNYAHAWDTIPLPRWLVNSLIVTCVVTVVNLVIDSMAGYAFAKMRFRGRNLAFTAMLATVMVPIPVTILPTYLLANRFGLLDTYRGLILPALAYPLGVFLMRQFISTLPSEILDAARIDGLSELSIYVRIILPLAVPGLAVLGLFTFFQQWSSLLWPLISTTNDNVRTVQAGIAGIPGEFTTDWGLVAAATILSIIPMLVAFLLAQRYVGRGLTGGRTMKG